MSDGDEIFGCIAGLLGLMLVVAAVAVAVAAVITGGGVFGAGKALVNYFHAFRENVRPETVPT